MTITAGATSRLPTRFGDFGLQVFTSTNAQGQTQEHLALATGVLSDNALVRVHSEYATGDIFGSLRCDCRDQLELSLERIAEEGHGLLIYLRGHEGRGIGLGNKIRAYALQEKGMDTVDANTHLGFGVDERDYADAADILKHYNLGRIRLLTNNREKILALLKAVITVTTLVPLWAATNPNN